MKKQITITALGILMLASAMAMYGGESVTFETNLTNPVYTVSGNTSSLEGLNITLQNNSITISPELNYKPDNFTLIFFDNVTREVEKIIYRGGGSRKTKYVDNNMTVYVPEYINITNEVEKVVEVEKIIDRVEFQETGFKLWHLLFGMIITGLFIWWMVSREKKYPSAEEIVEDSE